MMLIRYHNNASGGRWWLEDKDWYALEAAGWTVDWCKYNEKEPGDGRFLGALASTAEKDFPSVADAMSELQSITGQDVSDEGCDCCGPPHCFSWTNEKGEYQEISGEECCAFI